MIQMWDEMRSRDDEMERDERDGMGRHESEMGHDWDHDARANGRGGCHLRAVRMRMERGVRGGEWEDM